MLIFDNSLINDNLRNKSICDLIFNSKHYNIILIISTQSSLKLTPEARYMFDTIFLFNNYSISEKKRLYDKYCDIFPNFEIFKKYYNKITENYGIMVIDYNYNFDISTMIYYYKVNNININNLLDKNKFIKNKYERKIGDIINIKILQEKINELEKRIEKLENDLNSKNNNTIYI